MGDCPPLGSSDGGMVSAVERIVEISLASAARCILPCFQESIFNSRLSSADRRSPFRQHVNGGRSEKWRPEGSLITDFPAPFWAD
jgi:hypothetical protein